MPIDVVAGRTIHVVAAIGDPAALIRQFEQLGARVEYDVFRDHHAFTDAEMGAIARRLAPDALVVCTLKDAVKLRNRWPREGPALWYVSQRVIVERGAGAIEGVLDELLRARHPNCSNRRVTPAPFVLPWRLI